MKLPPDPNRLWPLASVKDFVRQAQRRVGPEGWDYLSRDMQEALIDQRVLYIAIAQSRTDVSCAALRCLRLDMMRAAGLLDD
jgi:hypothetical protein